MRQRTRSFATASQKPSGSAAARAHVWDKVANVGSDIPATLPSVDTPLELPTGEFGPRPTGAVTGGSGYGDPDISIDGAMVERNAVPAASNAVPRYPEGLRAAGVAGRVLLQFVVDTAGRVESSSVEELAATHPLFARAARDALAGWRFLPAESGGRKVRVRLQQPFDFRLER